MKKNAKAAIAVAAGVLLLLGGSGSLALWNASASTTGGQIAAGTLNVTGGGAGNWYVAQYSSGDLVTDPDAYTSPVTPGLIVPGDDYIFIAPAVTLTASGGKLDYVLTGADGTVVVKDAANNPVSSGSFAALGLTAEVGVMDGSDDATALGTHVGTVGTGAGTYSVTPGTVAEGSEIYEVTSATSGSSATFSTYLHVALSADDTTGTEAQGYSIALSDNGAIAVQQVNGVTANS
jgi:alternate signal-mediated exported protein